MTELDDVYSRSRLLYQTDPEQFERDQPLLARAFAEAKPAEELASLLSACRRRVQNHEQELRNQRSEEEHHLEVKDTQIRLLNAELADERHARARMEAELQQAKKDLLWATREPEITAEEEVTLTQLGIHKGLV